MPNIEECRKGFFSLTLEDKFTNFHRGPCPGALYPGGWQHFPFYYAKCINMYTRSEMIMTLSLSLAYF